MKLVNRVYVRLKNRSIVDYITWKFSKECKRKLGLEHIFYCIDGTIRGTFSIVESNIIIVNFYSIINILKGE